MERRSPFDDEVLRLINPLIKKCGKCNEVRPTTDFYGQRNNLGGRSHVCKDCYRIGYTAVTAQRQAALALTVTEKVCRDCGETKPLTEFEKSQTSKFGRRPECLACGLIPKREAWARRRSCPIARQKLREQDRIQGLRRYDLTTADYDAMFSAQNGVCAICGLPEQARCNRSEKVRRLCVDHDHQTGKIRSLLCAKCNHGIGNFCDSPELLRTAIEYLLRHRQQAAN